MNTWNTAIFYWTIQIFLIAVCSVLDLDAEHVASFLFLAFFWFFFYRNGWWWCNAKAHDRKPLNNIRAEYIEYYIAYSANGRNIYAISIKIYIWVFNQKHFAFCTNSHTYSHITFQYAHVLISISSLASYWPVYWTISIHRGTHIDYRLWEARERKGDTSIRSAISIQPA